MRRRDFIAAAGAAGTLGLVGGCQTLSAGKGGGGCAAKAVLELRQYHFDSAAYRDRFDAFLAAAMIPALNRQGIKPVGVFKMDQDKTLDLFVLIPYGCVTSVLTANTRLLADAAYCEAGKAVLESDKKDPVYTRYESSLLLSFDGCPQVEVPTDAETRLFQLRTYESHNTTKAKRKIEMFNSGEIETFRKTGLNPVFFGEGLVGIKLPSLTYMVGFADEDAQKAAWAAFRDHPVWKKMSADPYYKDTVSHITNLVVRPTAASQI